MHNPKQENKGVNNGVGDVTKVIIEPEQEEASRKSRSHMERFKNFSGFGASGGKGYEDMNTPSQDAVDASSQGQSGVNRKRMNWGLFLKVLGFIVLVVLFAALISLMLNAPLINSLAPAGIMALLTVIPVLCVLVSSLVASSLFEQKHRSDHLKQAAPFVVLSLALSLFIAAHKSGLLTLSLGILPYLPTLQVLFALLPIIAFAGIAIYNLVAENKKVGQEITDLRDKLSTLEQNNIELSNKLNTLEPGNIIQQTAHNIEQVRSTCAELVPRIEGVEKEVQRKANFEACKKQGLEQATMRQEMEVMARQLAEITVNTGNSSNANNAPPAATLQGASASPVITNNTPSQNNTAQL